MGETAFHRGLERKGAPVHVPGAVLELSIEKETLSVFDRSAGTRRATRANQGIEGLPSRVSIALQIGQLRPPAIRLLLPQEGFGERLKFACRLAGPCEAQDLEYGSLVIRGSLRPKPAPGTFDLRAKLCFSSRQRIFLQRVDSQRRCADVPRLDWRARQVVEPLAIPSLDD